MILTRNPLIGLLLVAIVMGLWARILYKMGWRDFPLVALCFGSVLGPGIFVVLGVLAFVDWPNGKPTRR